MDYESMTIAQLKDLLREKGLKVGGKKAELVERLADSESSLEPVAEEDQNTEVEIEAEEPQERSIREQVDWDWGFGEVDQPCHSEKNEKWDGVGYSHLLECS